MSHTAFEYDPGVEAVILEFIRIQRPDLTDWNIKVFLRSNYYYVASITILFDDLYSALGCDLMILVDKDWWFGVDGAERAHVIRHELAHVEVNKKGQLEYVEHDIELGLFIEDLHNIEFAPKDTRKVLYNMLKALRDGLGTDDVEEMLHRISPYRRIKRPK